MVGIICIDMDNFKIKDKEGCAKLNMNKTILRHIKINQLTKSNFECRKRKWSIRG